MKTYISLSILCTAGLLLAGCQADPLIIEKHYTENTQTIQTVDSPVSSLNAPQSQQASRPAPRHTVTINEQVESQQIILK
ncbi:MAG: hypothetical protein JKX85_08025 [Phycisphaeraceae bacterium]|nr:hypothetical protein [Phycisphaeraceae bacterium]